MILGHSSPQCNRSVNPALSGRGQLRFFRTYVIVTAQPIRCGPLTSLAPRPEFFAGVFLMANQSGIVRVDELAAYATWEHTECLVIKFDVKQMTGEQIKLLLKVRGKSEGVSITLPKQCQAKRGQIVGFDQGNHSLFVSIGEAD